MDTEEYFPRGNLIGIKKKPHSTDQIENDSLIFDTLKRKRSGSESKRPQFELHQKWEATNVNVVDLNYETVEIGMTLLACIRSITTLGVEVELPGRMCGKINITEVSDPFTKLMENKVNNCGASDDEAAVQMDEIFGIGQFLPTIVTEKVCSKKTTKLKLSTNPSNIQHGWSNESFTKGRLVWAAVESPLEHGYQLCVGNDKCRIFLPFKYVREGFKYVVGQPLWCVVRKSTTVSDISTVIVSALEKHVDSTSGSSDLLKLIPGAQINFTVDNIVKSGVVGTFQKHTGCIHAAFLKVPYEDVGSYKEGDNFKAFFLYVDPASSIAYFSMRGSSCTLPKFSNGTVLYSEVVKMVNRGLQIRLPNGSTGLIPAKRIRLSAESLNKIYPSGSQHNCQILDYRRLEQLYICTFQILTDKKSNDVAIGQLVEVKVVKIEKAGLVVQLDKITGFIANFHLSDAPYVESVKKEFNVGQTLKARIWSIAERGVNLTCKPFLVNSDIYFSSLEDVVIGKPYPGVVAKKNRNGILVVFYGDVRGMLPNSYVRDVFGADFLNALYEGEVIVPIIHKIEDNLLLLKVNNPGIPERTAELSVGDCYSGVITKITPNGFNVSVGFHNINGFVPVAHLSSSLSLAPLLLSTYKLDDWIDDLLCVSTTEIPILSMREFREYNIKNLTVPRFNDLAVGSIIRCSYLKTEDTHVCVSTPLIPHAEILNLFNDDLDEGVDGNFVNQQAIVAKVTTINPYINLLEITAKSNKIFNWDCDDLLSDLELFLQDLIRIETHLCNNFITQYHLGQRVSCTVTELGKNRCSVLLKHKVVGVVSKDHFPENIKIGDTMEGVVLWKNYKNNCLVVSLRENIINCVSSKQDYNVELYTSAKAHILSLEDDVVIGVMKNKQLIFLPNLCSNHILGVPKYKILQKVNVTVRRRVREKLICFDMLILTQLEKKLPVFNNTKKLLPEEVKVKEEYSSEDEIATVHNNSLLKKNKGIENVPIINTTDKSHLEMDVKVEEECSLEDKNTTADGKSSSKRTKKLSTINKTKYTHLGKEELVEVEERKSPEQETTTVANKSTSRKNKSVEKLGSAKRRKIAEPEEMDIKEEDNKSSSQHSKKLSTINKTKDAHLQKEKLVAAEKKKPSEQETSTVSNKKEADGKSTSQRSKKLSTIDKTKEELVEVEEKKFSEQQTKILTNKNSAKKKKMR